MRLAQWFVVAVSVTAVACTGVLGDFTLSTSPGDGGANDGTTADVVNPSGNDAGDATISPQPDAAGGSSDANVDAAVDADVDAGPCGHLSEPCCSGTCDDSTLSCAAGFCRPKAAGDTGTPCTLPSNCQSGICLPVGQPVGGGPGWTGSVCTQACATDHACVDGWKCSAQSGVAFNICKCAYAAETCNATDDDCDGTVDNEPAVDNACKQSTRNPLYNCKLGTCTCGGATCNGACVDTSTDAANCGACAKACATGATCSESACRCPASAPLECNGACIDPTSNSTSCGTCNFTCQSGQKCVNSSCACDPTTCSGCCSGSQCVLQPGVANCGRGGSACLTCDPNLADGCNGAGGCSCGGSPACGTGQACLGGSCQCNAQTCPGGCCQNGTCVAYAQETIGACGSNGQNCAGCNVGTANACSASGTCVCNGAAQCSGGTSCCAAGCTNVTSDAKNCGACGHGCGPGASCSGSVCAPTTLVTTDANLNGLYGLAVGNGILYGTDYYGPGGRVYSIPANASPYAGDPPWIYTDTGNPTTGAIAYDPYEAGGRIWFGNCPGGSTPAGVFGMPIAGSAAAVAVTFGENVWCTAKIAVDAGGIFWTATDGNNNMSHGFQGWKRGDPLVQSSVHTFLPNSVLNALGADAGYVYWSTGPDLYRQALADVWVNGAGGSGVTTMYGSPAQNTPITFDAANVYWYETATNAIYRQQKAGSPPQRVTNVAISDKPALMATDGVNVYWAGSTSTGALWYAAADGTSASENAIAKLGANKSIDAMTIDASYLYFTSCNAYASPCSIWRLAKL